MAATDAQIVVAASRWSDESQYLHEFIALNQLPAVIKIIKGQYNGLGVPTLPNPTLQSTALLVSAGMIKKLVAQSVKLKDGRKLTPLGPLLVIPESYPGYFELLSEEGKAIRCIESVLELSRRKAVHGCLVREPIRAVTLKSPNGEVTDGARIIAPGEIIVPCSEMQISGSRGKYLKCLDKHGGAFVFSLEQKGKFSALAREDNISGVHTVRTLLTKRLPITVRLVHGRPPKLIKTPFVPELRLLGASEEPHLFALPLQKETSGLMALPINAPLKVLKMKNYEQLRSLVEFERLVAKCNRLATEIKDRIQILPGRSESLRASYILRRVSSTSSDTSSNRMFKKRNEETHSREPLLQLVYEYDEIDQIYDYVRGFAPLPKNLLDDSLDYSPDSDKHSLLSSKGRHSPDPPEPPPIETIPSKKLLTPNKRTRKKYDKNFIEHKEKIGLPKLYIKNVQRTKLHRHDSPTKDSPSPITISPPILKSESPIFNIRYKSLTSLQQAMELEMAQNGGYAVIMNGGTLDSSHSGQTSGDSGAKLPEKRLKKLSRPRSLTNLVWGKFSGEASSGKTKPLASAPTSPEIMVVGNGKKSTNKFIIGNCYNRKVDALYL